MRLALARGAGLLATVTVAVACAGACAGAPAGKPLAGTPRADDPLAFAPMLGPFASLAAFCAGEEREHAGDDWFSVGECPETEHAHPLDAPFKAAALVRFVEDNQVPLDLWHLALQTDAGWFVAEAPMCAARGCANDPIHIRALPLAHGGQLVGFSFKHDEQGRVGPFDGQEEGVALVLCAMGNNDRPACARSAIPLEVDASGTDDEVAGGSMEVKLRLELTSADLRDGMLALDVTAREQSVTGTILEANEWRKRLTGLLGRHVIALP